MKNNKLSRLNHTMIREISYTLETEVKDKHIKFVTITDVRVTNDLSFAKVYFTVLNDNYRDSTIKALKQAKGFIRKQIAERIELRHIPELDFIYDESIEYGNKIEEDIKRIHESQWILFLIELMIKKHDDEYKYKKIDRLIYFN